MPLAEQVVARLGAVEPDRVPRAVRTHAENTLACVARAPRSSAVAELEEDDLLARTARLAMLSVYARAGHRGSDRVPDLGDTGGCAVAAAAIGAAAAWGAPGPAVVAAVALGLELRHRLAQGLGPGHREAGWCVGGTADPPAAALAAALVARTAPERMAHAIGIATSLTLGHGEASESDVGTLHVGKAASNGLLAAALAVQGSTASATALEGPRGYFHVLGADGAAEVVLDGLGQRWSIEAPPGAEGRKPTDPFVVELRAATDTRARDLAHRLLELPSEEVT